MAKAALDFRQMILTGEIDPAMGFAQKVWAITARIPHGKLTTYGLIAQALGTRAARAVGGALNRNPYAPQVPCHRVVGTDGRLVGFAAGLDKKARMLKREGIQVTAGRVELQRYLWRP